jgi:hypothetical protein
LKNFHFNEKEEGCMSEKKIKSITSNLHCVRINSSRNQKRSLILLVEGIEAEKIYTEKNRIDIGREQKDLDLGWGYGRAKMEILKIMYKYSFFN